MLTTTPQALQNLQDAAERTTQLASPVHGFNGLQAAVAKYSASRSPADATACAAALSAYLTQARSFAAAQGDELIVRAVRTTILETGSVAASGLTSAGVTAATTTITSAGLRTALAAILAAEGV